MGWHGVDPQEGREKHQDREDREMAEYPGLAEHDELNRPSVNEPRHTDVRRTDGGGAAHVAGRVAHAQQTKDTYGDHSPRGAAMPAGGSRDIDQTANAITSPKSKYQHIPASHPPALPGQSHGQGVLPLVWPDKRTADQKKTDMHEMRREHDEDNRREWYE